MNPVGSPQRRAALVAQPLDYALAVGAVALCTALALPFRDHTPADNLAMVYLTGVVLVAARLGLGPSVLASITGIAAFNFFFTRPYFTLNFYDSHYYFTFAFMLITSLVVGSLTAELARHGRQVSDRERETHTLYDLTRALSAESTIDGICQAAEQHLAAPFDLSIAVVLREGGALIAHPPSALIDDRRERLAIDAALAHGTAAGRDSAAAPLAQGLYLPLMADNATFGVLGVTPGEATRQFGTAETLQFSTFASLIAGALQRARLSDAAEHARVDSENERLRNVLLSSLSHDLRTPLTVMNGQVSSLLRLRRQLPGKAVDELTGLWGQLTRLQAFVAKLLDMAAITSGAMTLNFQPYMIEEIIGAALAQVKATRAGRTLRTRMSGALPMVRIDGGLVEQVFVNLLENAFQHTADDGDIVIAAERAGRFVRVSVSDNGPGLAEGDSQRIFEQFQTGQRLSSDRSGGTGLGLAICRGIVEAHGGRIHAETGGELPGASFVFTLPIADVAA